MHGEADRNDELAEQIAAELDAFEHLANLPTLLDDAIPFFPRRRDYQAFWERNREITDLFRGCHLRRDDRERLWARKRALCDQVRDLQICEREARENASRRNREEILFLIQEALSWAKGAETFDHLREVRTRLADAAILLKERQLAHGDRRECWERWREAKRLLGYRQEELTEERRREREARAHGRRERLEDAIRRRRAYIEDNDRMIACLRDAIDELEAEIAAAWTEAWADRARERVQAKHGKIAGLERRNVELETEIAEITMTL